VPDLPTSSTSIKSSLAVLTDSTFATAKIIIWLGLLLLLLLLLNYYLPTTPISFLIMKIGAHQT
jgi:hypothetical protein